VATEEICQSFHSSRKATFTVTVGDPLGITYVKAVPWENSVVWVRAEGDEAFEPIVVGTVAFVEVVRVLSDDHGETNSVSQYHKPISQLIVVRPLVVCDVVVLDLHVHRVGKPLTQRVQELSSRILSFMQECLSQVAVVTAGVYREPSSATVLGQLGQHLVVHQRLVVVVQV
jgi:hypothetical protein